jgi:hypothetical protein
MRGHRAAGAAPRKPPYTVSSSRPSRACPRHCGSGPRVTVSTHGGARWARPDRTKPTKQVVQGDLRQPYWFSACSWGWRSLSARSPPRPAGAAMSEQARGVLADEQAALRRVATLVARQPSPAEVFAAVTEEAGKLPALDNAHLIVYERDETATVVASWNLRGARRRWHRRRRPERRLRHHRPQRPRRSPWRNDLGSEPARPGNNSARQAFGRSDGRAPCCRASTLYPAASRPGR